MKLYGEINLQNKIVPLYNTDYDILAKIKKNTPCRIEIVRERNYEFHKKVMALFNLGYENQDLYNNFDHYRGVMTMKAGFYDAVETDKGTVWWPQSLSFTNMAQDVFEDLFKRLLDVIAKQLDCEPQEIRKQVDDFM